MYKPGWGGRLVERQNAALSGPRAKWVDCLSRRDKCYLLSGGIKLARPLRLKYGYTLRSLPVLIIIYP